MRVVLVGVVVAAASCSVLGQLTPPAGPVDDSFKSLDEVEPRIPLSQETTPGDASRLFIITAPGSYYLTQGHSTPKLCIDVNTTGDVSIDLNGFTLEQTSGLLSVVYARAGVEEFSLRNGTLRGGGMSLNVEGARARVEGVTVIGSATHGIYSISDIDVRDSIVRNTGNRGVWTDGVLRATDVTLRDISGEAFYCGAGSRIERAHVSNYGTNGSVNGMYIAQEGSIVDSRFENYLGMTSAIFCGNHTVVDGVQILTTSGRALYVGLGSMVSDLLVDHCGTSGSSISGVFMSTGGRITNSVLNNYNGDGASLQTGNDCVAIGITVYDSSATGVDMGTSCRLQDSLIDVCFLNSLDAGSWCTIRGNDIERGSALAIKVLDNSVIDENRVYGTIEFRSSNQVTRNLVDNGGFTITGSSNEVGPTNDLTSPWSNFIK